MSLPKPDELDVDLELPALDGEDDHAESDVSPITLDVGDENAEGALDDTTGEDRPLTHALDEAGLSTNESEVGWLLDAESAGASLDVGAFDVAIEEEGKVLEGDESDTRGGLDDLVDPNETFVADGGEEGPLADDEELREEDLPALDADDDGDVSDDELYDRTLLAAEGDLRWDDRAWARVSDPSREPTAVDDLDDSAVLSVPGDDPRTRARDETWRAFEQASRVMAATTVPGDSIVVALGTPDRSRALIVRILPDGEARIIAEIDPQAGGLRATDDGEACVVTQLRWDAGHGWLWVTGTFGIEAYRPA